MQRSIIETENNGVQLRTTNCGDVLMLIHYKDNSAAPGIPMYCEIYTILTCVQCYCCAETLFQGQHMLNKICGEKKDKEGIASLLSCASIETC